MRVLHITRDFPPRINGGISTAVGGMVRCCTDLGIRCAAISFDGWRPRKKGGRTPDEPVVAAPTAAHDGDAPVLRLSAPDRLPTAHQFAEGVAPDLIHVHHSMLWPFAAQLRARLEVPAVLQIHVLQAAQSRLRGLTEPTMSLNAQTAAVRASDAIVVPSRAAGAMLAEAYPALQTPVRVIGLGIDDSPGARAAVSARAAGISAGPVLYAGRFADINGTAEFLAAIPRVLKRVPEARFVIAGGVPDNRKAERRWHRRFRDSASASVRARVTFTGWQNPEALREHYASAGVLCSPSWLETFGLVVLEGMLHGLPIAATRSGGVEELIEHGRTGLLSAPRDVDGLTDHLIELLARPARAQKLGQAAAEAVRAQRLWTHVGPKLGALYRELATGGS